MGGWPGAAGVTDPSWGVGSWGTAAGAGGDEGFAIPIQVNYVGRGGRLFEPGEAVHGSTAVVSNFLQTGPLWNQVRVMGGAYGAMVSFGRASGTISMLSYRDPNLEKTIRSTSLPLHFHCF